MRKIYLLLLLWLSFSSTYAIDYSCFEYSWALNWVENKTIKVITDDTNNYYFQDNKLLNSKVIKSYQKKYIEFKIISKDSVSENKTIFSTDFDQYEKNKEIVVKFDTTLLKNTFNYDLFTNNYYYDFQISKDWKSWYEVEDDIRNYDLDYLKITFINKELKNTSITNLSFFENWNNEILVNSLSNSDINVYNSYFCSDDELVKLIWKTKITQYFPVDLTTKTFNLILSKNPNFNPKHITDTINKDTDNDWVIDTQDNCVYNFNPNQLDSTADGVWDVCSDKDSDTILWDVDNCPTLYNPEQKDENKNWIWDLCEKDTDLDKVFDSIDNCSEVYNPDQIDTDFDWIWDLCDNCLETYNPDQKDTDKDNIWNSCDKKDDRYIESNKNFFIALILAIVSLFLIWIFVIIKQIKNTTK